jgi:hypothetical protein
MLGLGVQISSNMYMDIFETDMAHEIVPGGPWWIVLPQNLSQIGIFRALNPKP